MRIFTATLVTGAGIIEVLSNFELLLGAWSNQVCAGVEHTPVLSYTLRIVTMKDENQSINLFALGFMFSCLPLGFMAVALLAS